MKILIIEDDALFVKDNDIILNYFNNIPEDANIVHYGYIKIYGETIKYNDLYNKVTNGTHTIAGLQCYGICNKETLEKLITYQKNIFCVADQFINKLINNYYISNKTLCIDPIHNKKEINELL